MTKTLREALLTFELREVVIPRPKCVGLEFVPTRGRQGFYKTIRNEGHKYGISIKSMGPRRPTLPAADFWTQPQVNKENQNTSNMNGAKTDVNANEILPPKYPSNKNYYAIAEEPDIVEPEPDYDDQPVKHAKIPVAPPLPDFLLKRTIRL